MAIELPDLSEEAFGARLREAAGMPISVPAEQRMYAHYQELRRWSRRTTLVGPGLADLVPERLFAESLAALPLVGSEAREILDVGSGAGFPGLVLAAALPESRVTLVEPRQKKWAFLRAAADRASLSSICLNARVSAALPSGIPEAIDRVVVRALRLETEHFESLSKRLAPGGSFLIWASDDLRLPAGFAETRAVELAGGRGRIQEVVPPSPREAYE